MTFNYTHGDSDVESSAVYEAYYNSDDNKLAVVLSSGHGYVYSGVPQSVYDSIVSGPSAGKTYATVVKRSYGPGESLGYVGFDNDDEFAFGVPAPAMTAVGTPKGLTLAPNAVVTGPRVTLGSVVPPVTKPPRKHAVKFTVEGGNDVKTYSVDADSVEQAVSALGEALAAVGLDFDVKEVTVYFE